jgi:hypothetical protein
VKPVDEVEGQRDSDETGDDQELIHMSTPAS